jgi:hypothetical protein
MYRMYRMYRTYRTYQYMALCTESEICSIVRCAASSCCQRGSELEPRSLASSS